MLFKQTWWDNNVKEKFDEFKSWIGDFNAESKVHVRAYVASKGYKSLIDCGCGPATEHDGYKNDGYGIDYVGVDSSKVLHDFIVNRGVPAVHAPVEQIPVEDSSFDVCFSRHVLEHLPTYMFALNEFVRIAKKEVINVFFIIPTEEKEQINYDGKENLYHNRYNKKDIENLLNENQKVDNFYWEQINKQETILHVFVKESK
jgi:ubiquinone/menaquinone biosynthesis C-methylase UbiE